MAVLLPGVLSLASCRTIGTADLDFVAAADADAFEFAAEGEDIDACDADDAAEATDAGSDLTGSAAACVPGVVILAGTYVTLEADCLSSRYRSDSICPIPADCSAIAWLISDLSAVDT